MFAAPRFLWNATRGYRLRPWRSPYLRWRIETYSGLPAEAMSSRDVLRFIVREHRAETRFLAWCGAMAGYRRHSRHPAQSAQAGPAEQP